VVTFDDVKDLALALPEVALGTFGRGGASTTFEVRGKGFARFGGKVNGLPDADAADTLVIRLPPGQRDALLDTFPDRFFITPHYEAGSAVLTRLSFLKRSDLAEIRDLLTDAWFRFAPKRLAAAFRAGER
jgi:hypothetical protein